MCIRDRLRSDQGTEFTGKQCQDLLKEYSIRSSWSTAETPRANGRVEVMNRVLFGAVNANLAHSWLTMPFWELCLGYAAYCSNRVSRIGRKFTPFEVLYGTKPDVSKVRVWGCDTWVLSSHQALGDHGKKCLFMGIAHGADGWVLFDPNTRETFPATHVVSTRI